MNILRVIYLDQSVSHNHFVKTCYIIIQLWALDFFDCGKIKWRMAVLQDTSVLDYWLLSINWD